MTFGIIGTAGRGPDYDRLTPDLYHWMYDETLRIINTQVEEVQLVSGGAAFSDHIAVLLYSATNIKELTLHLPAPMGPDGLEETQAGKVANYYHHKFGRKIYNDKKTTLKHISSAITGGAKYTVNEGFKQRNVLVARDADFMIAMTFGEGQLLKDGGTAHTMSMFLTTKDANRSFHLNLNTREVYSPARVNIYE